MATMVNHISSYVYRYNGYSGYDVAMMLMIFMRDVDEYESTNALVLCDDIWNI